MAVQRTGASRHAEWRCGGPAWLAPVADLGVRYPQQTKPPKQMIAIGYVNGEGQVRAAYQTGADHDQRRGGDPALAWSACPAATLTRPGSEP